jgi:two-component system cell cycle sensor histidine kinase/response regulator CckA
MTGPIAPRGGCDTAARTLAHDVSNLLTAIIGAAESALDRYGIDAETRADIEHIREGARRAGALLQNINPTRQGPPERTVISVSETIKATSRLLAHRLGSNISLTVDLAETDDGTQARAWQLDRVLLNLIANARHAMERGGMVALRTGRRLLVAATPCVPDTIPPGDYIVITVTDNGSGIERDRLARVFDRGESSRLDRGGTGLGLASVRDIVGDAKGFLAIESVRERGTSVSIFLPRHDRAAPPAAVAAPSPEGCAGVVLLVDDDPLVRQVSERILRRAGWTVVCAESAELALGILAKSACDLMITDVAMQGMDGLALTRRVLERKPGLPVILTSGYSQAAALAGLGSACVAFLAKPYGRADLLAAVTSVTRTVTAGDE